MNIYLYQIYWKYQSSLLNRDIFSILRDPVCLKNVLDLMLAKLQNLKWGDVDVVVGLESRGFILAPLLALQLNAGFVPVRKKGRLPGNCKEVSYSLEYRSVSICIFHQIWIRLAEQCNWFKYYFRMFLKFKKILFNLDKEY